MNRSSKIMIRMVQNAKAAVAATRTRRMKIRTAIRAVPAEAVCVKDGTYTRKEVLDPQVNGLPIQLQSHCPSPELTDNILLEVGNSGRQFDQRSAIRRCTGNDVHSANEDLHVEFPQHHIGHEKRRLFEGFGIDMCTACIIESEMKVISVGDRLKTKLFCRQFKTAAVEAEEGRLGLSHLPNIPSGEGWSGGGEGHDDREDFESSAGADGELPASVRYRSEEHTSELQSQFHLIF